RKSSQSAREISRNREITQHMKSPIPKFIIDESIIYKKTLHQSFFCDVKYYTNNGNYESITNDKDDEYTVELRLTDTYQICLIAILEKNDEILLQKFINSKNSSIKKESLFRVNIRIIRDIDECAEIFRISLSTPHETERF
ncbi:19998_t:CDS:1, partial [Dentiscutata erythropus]